MSHVCYHSCTALSPLTSLSTFCSKFDLSLRKVKFAQVLKKSPTKVSDSEIYCFLDIQLVKPTFSLWDTLHAIHICICFLPGGKPFSLVLQIVCDISKIAIYFAHRPCIGGCFE